MSSNPYIMNPSQWVDQHADYLYAFALTRLGEEELVRDIVQETFLAALERQNSFEGRSSERTWLTAILKNKIFDVYRQRSRKGVAKLPDTGFEKTEFFDPDLNNWKREHWPEPFGVEEHDPLRNKEFHKVLEGCMRKLPPLWLNIFKMKHLDDESKEVICSAMKVSESNFWIVIHRAKVSLRSCLQRQWLNL